MSAASPTWTDDIQKMFTQTEIHCMQRQGIDLSSYDSVSNNAQQILSAVVGTQDPTQAPSSNNPPTMPPSPPTADTPYWTLDMINTFATWIQQGTPQA